MRKMKLIITRHGETEENVNGIFMGHLPGKLTVKGQEQAKKLAERLKDEKFEIIFSSDLARASDTAKEIAKFHQDIPIYFIEDLRERFMGGAQGKSQKELGDSFEDRSNMIEKLGAEKTSEIIDRARQFHTGLFEKFYGKNVLLVGHAGINTAIIADILDEEWMSFFNENRPGNTAITIFEFDKDKKPKLILMNCSKHLEEIQNGK